MDPILIKLDDGSIITLYHDEVEECSLLKEMCEANCDELIPIPNVSKPTFELFIELLKTNAYGQLSTNELKTILQIADHLQASKSLHAIFDEFARRLEGRTQEEMAEILK